MRGFQTQTKRKAHANGYAGGGMVRGPGSGISDDVPDHVPEGTYIMPADSTAQLGPDKLAGMGARGFKAGGKKAAGGKSVPVNLSNGEFKLPPEQVHAVGMQALEQMKNATHTPAAQQAGEPEMFFANGGAVFGSRGLEGLKAMIPKVAAMGFKQNPQYLADGGQVRSEEGGGLSKEAVMAAIAKQAAQQRPAAQPAQQPAQQTAARGFSRPATDFLRNPGGILREREREAMGYADGGMVDEERQRLANQTAMYVRGAQEAAATRAPQPQPAAVTPMATQQAPAVTPAAPSTSPSTLYMQDRAQELKDQVGQGNYAQAAGTAARTAVQGLGMYGIELADKAGTPLINAARGFGRGVLGSDASAAPAAAAPAAPSPAAVAPATPNAAGGGSGMVNPSTEPTSAVTPNAGPQVANTPTAPSAAAPTPGNVTRVDNTYSGTNVTGDITVNGQAPRGGFMVADGPRGFIPGIPATAAPQGVTAPTVLNSSNSWQARNDLRNLEVSASSITNNGGRFDQTNGRNPAQAAYLSALQADATARGAQPGLDAAAMRENAGIQREGMQQDGATTRTGMTEQGANTREAGRTALQRDEFNLRREASGFQTRAAAQQEQLRNTLIDPKSTPEQRKQAQEYLQALAISGKEPSPQYKSYVMPAIRNADGSTTEGGVYQENTRTGEGRWVTPNGGGQAQQGALPKVATPQDLVALKSGTRFVDSNGVERIKK